MLQYFLSRAALIFLSTTLAVLAVACREEKQTTASGGTEQHVLNDKSTANPDTLTAPLVSPTSQLPSVTEPNSFEQGLDKATSAFSISQSAQSIEDWNLVASQFQEAIAFLKAVPVDSPYFPSAQTKITEFQRQLKYAQRQATRPINPKVEIEPKKVVIAVPQPSLTPKVNLLPQTIECDDTRVEQNLSQCSRRTLCTETLTRSERRKLPLRLLVARKCPPRSAGQEEVPPIMALPPPDLLNKQQVFVAPIKRRVGGTPIVEVTFNGNQQFEMILDTGASGTVITQKMASSLGVMPIGKAKANTASSKAVEFPIGYVDSMEVGGARVNQVAVAIAGSDLETGLLGHDFFGDFDLTIKRDVIEFRPQSHLPIEPQGNGRQAVPNSTSDRDSLKFPEPQSEGSNPPYVPSRRTIQFSNRYRKSGPLGN